MGCDEVNVKDIQAVLLRMLRDIDALCRKHHITYQLFAGSALGVVRHKGFIPWDDDLDIAMTREDYDRFLAIAEQELDTDKYYLQKEFSEHFPMFYSKLRMNGTTYMERYHPKDPMMHQGVFVDIFPLDNLSDHDFVAKLQFYASKIVIAKCLSRRGYSTDSIKKKLFMLLCGIFPLKPFLRFAQRRKDQSSKKVHSFFGGSSKYHKSIYPRNILHTIKMQFENGEYPVSVQADTLLTTLYGDYMTLPDVSPRNVKQHYLKVDLDRPYQNYLKWQKDQIITEYTKSIR